MARQRSATPIETDVAEQPVFNLVPFARAGGKMTDRNLQPKLVSQALQGDLPHPAPAAIAATAIRGDQQFGGLRIDRDPHVVPPPSQALHRKLCSVMVAADADPPRVGAQIIDPIGNRLAQILVNKIVHAYLLGLPRRAPFPPAIL